ncbi:putative UPF0481 protein [Tanacetum coccineum]
MGTEREYDWEVLESLRCLNPNDYTPRIISIGPLHKEDIRLKAMEEHKVVYMYRLYCRTMEATNRDTDQTARNYVQAVLGLVTRARACYAPSFTQISDFKLAEMMVIDGCFILKLLYMSQYGIAEGGPLFDNILVMHDVKYDLLLLENQIPFFILEVLFRITFKWISKSVTVIDLVLYFFKDMNILSNNELTIKDYEEDHCHILGLLQSCYRPKNTIRGRVPTISYSATEIAGAGVTFKAQKDGDSLLAMRFKQSSFVSGLGTLLVRKTSFRILVLCIRNSTPSFIRNLIAYEQCYPLSRHYVTSFAFLMDRLIDTKDDVSLLARSKVLEHNLGACEDVTNLFNNICNGVVLRDFYYTEQWSKLDEYCNHFGPRILISLRRLYKSTTWKTLTVIVALIIFSLTLLQTVYTIRNA